MFSQVLLSVFLFLSLPPQSCSLSSSISTSNVSEKRFKVFSVLYLHLRMNLFIMYYAPFMIFSYIIPQCLCLHSNSVFLPLNLVLFSLPKIIQRKVVKVNQKKCPCTSFSQLPSFRSNSKVTMNSSSPKRIQAYHLQQQEMVERKEQLTLEQHGLEHRSIYMKKFFHKYIWHYTI